MKYLKSNKNLKSAERVPKNGIITRSYDLIQIEPDSNMVTFKITDKCFLDSALQEPPLWQETRVIKPRFIENQLLTMLYDEMYNGMKAETEAEGQFNCEVGDFDIINLS